MVAVAEEVMEDQAVVPVLVERRTSFAEQLPRTNVGDQTRSNPPREAFLSRPLEPTP